MFRSIEIPLGTAYVAQAAAIGDLLALILVVSGAMENARTGWNRRWLQVEPLHATREKISKTGPRTSKKSFPRLVPLMDSQLFLKAPFQRHQRLMFLPMRGALAGRLDPYQ